MIVPPDCQGAGKAPAPARPCPPRPLRHLSQEHAQHVGKDAEPLFPVVEAVSATPPYR